MESAWKDCGASCSATADDRMVHATLIPVADVFAGFRPPETTSS
jgi:hypothetical protein